MRKKPLVYAIGHSTRTIEEFIDILKAFRIDCVVDVRTIPRSRRVPQFNIETLPKSLHAANVEYITMKGLGGLRHPARDSVNTGWHNGSFRGFADYMQTEEFEKNLETLIELAGKNQVVLMCAEAVPWRCHRSLIADALVVRGIEVVHLLGLASHRPHRLTSFAKVCGTRITYPPDETPAE